MEYTYRRHALRRSKLLQRCNIAFDHRARTLETILLRNPQPEQWRYTYTSDGFVQETYPPDEATNGRYLSYAYNQGRLSSLTMGPSGAQSVWTWGYTAGVSGPTSATDPTGIATTRSYDAQQLVKDFTPPYAGGTAGYRITRDGEGKLTDITNPQNSVWNYTYDAKGNVASITNPLLETTNFTYNDQGQITTATDARGNQTFLEYAGSSCACGSPGLLTRVTRVDTQGPDRITDIDYDANDNLVSIIDPAIRQTAFSYDNQNRLVSITKMAGTPEAQTTTLTRDVLGRVASVTDADGNVTTYQYDHMGRIVSVDDSLAGGPVTYVYDAFGNVTQVTDGNGHAWNYYYDQQRRLYKTVDPQGKTLRRYFDGAGRLTRVGAMSDGTFEPMDYTYDTAAGGTGLLTRVDYGAGGWAEYDYDTIGRVVELRDDFQSFFGLQPKTYTYDDAGRLVQLGNAGKSLSYTYDDAGDVLSMTDWFGNRTEYAYNDLGELTSVTALAGTANAKSWSFAYNALGQLDNYTHPNGMLTDYVYDANGVLTDILHKSGAVVKQGFSYEYDNVFNITRLTQEDGSFWEYGYDNRYRLTSAVRHNAADTIRASYAYAYDDGDNMTSRTEPWADDFEDGLPLDDGWSGFGPWTATGGVLVKSDDAQNARADVLTTDNDLEVRFAYQLGNNGAAVPRADVTVRHNAATGERLMVRLDTTKTSLHYYDGSAWTQLASNSSGASAAETWYDARIVVDGANLEVWRREKGEDAYAQILSYGGAPITSNDRLMFHGPPGQQPSYDNIMILADDLNRTVTYTYRTNNEIATMTDYDGAASYAFDQWGRMNTETLNGVTTKYSWTKANLLKAVDIGNDGTDDVEYMYRGDLTRNWGLENSLLTNVYHYDAGFNILNEERDPGSGFELFRTYVPDLAEVMGNDPATNGQFRYLTHDYLGSTRGMWDDSIAQLGSREYAPYGSPYLFSGPSDVTQLFTGLDVEKVTGKYYAPFRFLDPALGRWLKRDPLGMVDGPNMYGYVTGGPVNFTDATGLGPIGDIFEAITDLFKGIWCSIADCDDDDGDNNDADVPTQTQNAAQTLGDMCETAIGDGLNPSTVPGGMPGNPLDPVIRGATSPVIAKYGLSQAKNEGSVSRLSMPTDPNREHPDANPIPSRPGFAWGDLRKKLSRD